MGKVESIRASLLLHGLRAVCLVCKAGLRFFPGERIEVEGRSTTAFRLTCSRRLRELACPACAAPSGSIRSRYWIEMHPELARTAAERARRMSYALR